VSFTFTGFEEFDQARRSSQRDSMHRTLCMPLDPYCRIMESMGCFFKKAHKPDYESS
jgi:hypothetical protein